MPVSLTKQNIKFHWQRFAEVARDSSGSTNRFRFACHAATAISFPAAELRPLPWYLPPRNNRAEREIEDIFLGKFLRLLHFEPNDSSFSQNLQDRSVIPHGLPFAKDKHSILHTFVCFRDFQLAFEQMAASVIKTHLNWPLAIPRVSRDIRNNFPALNPRPFRKNSRMHTRHILAASHGNYEPRMGAINPNNCAASIVTSEQDYKRFNVQFANILAVGKFFRFQPKG